MLPIPGKLYATEILFSVLLFDGKGLYIERQQLITGRDEYLTQRGREYCWMPLLLQGYLQSFELTLPHPAKGK